MEPELRRVFCSAHSCKLPIRKGDLYHRFWNNQHWLSRLRADGSVGQVVCFRHFSPSQYTSDGNEGRKLKKNAIPDRRILCCRFCMDLSIDMKQLQTFPNSDPNALTLQDIVETIGIRIDPDDDGFPAMICLTCSSKVRYIKRIQRQFQESDLKFRQVQASLEVEHRSLLVETEDDQLVKLVVKNADNPVPPSNGKVLKTAVSPKPPERPVRTGALEDIIITRSVREQPKIVTNEVVDVSLNSIFMIETMDEQNCVRDGQATDPLELHTEDTIWIPPVKKMKKEIS